MSIYAAHLYDAVMLYATALDGILKSYDNVTKEIIDKIVSNGTLIVEKLKNYTYNSKYAQFYIYCFRISLCFFYSF